MNNSKMSEFLKKVLRIMKWPAIPLVLADYYKFKNKIKEDRFSLLFRDFYPIPGENTIDTGFDRHYVYHVAWAMRKVREISPQKHVDISSSLYFAAGLSAFIPVDFYDFRPADIELSNLLSKKGDLLALPFADNSVPSLSCMHTVEHVGLGRYGDAIDPDGDLKAIAELKRVVAPGGSLLFVVPMGKARIEFNAHRIYSYDQIISYFKDLNLKEFSLIPERRGGIIVHAKKEQADQESYACGLFWFTK